MRSLKLPAHAPRADASLAKEHTELRQQEVNEQADSEAWDFGTPWVDLMSQNNGKVFAQQLGTFWVKKRACPSGVWKRLTRRRRLE